MWGIVLQGARAVSLPQLKARLLDGHNESCGSLKDLLPKCLQAKLHGIATELKFRRGECEIACQEGKADFIYLVGTGIARVSRLSPAGRRQVLAFIYSGGIFGLPEEGRYLNSVDVIGPATIYRIGWTPFKELMQEEPEVKSAFLMRIAFDYRRAQHRIAVLSQQNASQKLASFLLDLHEYPEFRDKRHGYIRLPLSRSDLADYFGVAPETLARAMAKMEAAGILLRESLHLLRIKDIVLLGRIARGPRRTPSRRELSEPLQA